jgi:hypothetical protein
VLVSSARTSVPGAWARDWLFERRASGTFRRPGVRPARPKSLAALLTVTERRKRLKAGRILGPPRSARAAPGGQLSPTKGSPNKWLLARVATAGETVQNGTDASSTIGFTTLISVSIVSTS